MRSIFIFILLFAAGSKATAQKDEFEIQTNVKMGFSRDVLKVTETDVGLGQVIVHSFNKWGYLVEYHLTSSTGEDRTTFKYDGGRLAERTEYHKDKGTERIKTVTLKYKKGRIISEEMVFTMNWANKNTETTKERSRKAYAYEKGILESTKTLFDSGRTEEEIFSYNPGDSLVKTKLIVDVDGLGGPESILRKDYKNGLKVASYFYHDNQQAPYMKQVYVYNQCGQLLKELIYYDESLDHGSLYEYSADGILLRQQVYLDGAIAIESFYNEHGDLVKKIVEDEGTFDYTNEYNSQKDIVRIKNSDGEIVKIFEYVYSRYF